MVLMLGGKTVPFTLSGTSIADGSSIAVPGFSLGLGVDGGTHAIGVSGGLGSLNSGDITHAQVYYRYRFLRRSWFCLDVPISAGIITRSGGRTEEINFSEGPVFPFVRGVYGQVGFGSELLPSSFIGLRLVTLVHFGRLDPVKRGHHIWTENEEGEEVRTVETFGPWSGALATSIGGSVGLELRFKVENTN